MSEVRVTDLNKKWKNSTGSPLTLFEKDDPQVETGSYVIQGNERVPEKGTTSHGGAEISVILEGEVVLGVPETNEEYVCGSNSLIVIPAGVEHYSQNRSDEPAKLVYTILGEL